MNRYEHIDIARGIAILLVILGHSCTTLDGVNRVILSLPMPLVFLLFGMFARPVEHSLRAVGGGDIAENEKTSSSRGGIIFNMCTTGFYAVDKSRT